jgi:hypothetical protein
MISTFLPLGVQEEAERARMGYTEIPNVIISLAIVIYAIRIAIVEGRRTRNGPRRRRRGYLESSRGYIVLFALKKNFRWRTWKIPAIRRIPI